MEQIPELQSLLAAVETKYGHPIATTNDFEALSIVMMHEMGESLGATTLKRLWGYISQRATPRLSTLDILSRYAGYKDFTQYCEAIQPDSEVSSYFGGSFVLSEKLVPGSHLTVGWTPNRVVRLLYLGKERFEVEESRNAKLRVGDRFCQACFFKGFPLIISSIERGNERTLSYIAGKDGGLNLLDLTN